MPEEDEVTLVVQSAHSPALELWRVVEQSTEHTSHSAAEAGREVVQQHLGSDTIKR